MRVHQPGSHLLQERGVRVRDWSWKQTGRRFSTLGRLVTPYRGRAILSLLTLLLATAIALAPPFLAKFALDDAVNGDAGGKLYLIVGLFLFAGLANWGMTYAQTYLTGWVGERMLADLRTTLFDHLQDLSLGFYERNRARWRCRLIPNGVDCDRFQPGPAHRAKFGLPPDRFRTRYCALEPSVANRPTACGRRSRHRGYASGGRRLFR